MRQCVVLRELLPRQLLFRVVRSRDQHGNVVVTLADAASTAGGDGARKSQASNGRSAYVSKQADIVRQATNRNRLGRSLRCKVPPHIARSLQEQARRWARMSNDEKGLLFCEVYSLDGMYLPHEQVQHCLPVGHDSSFFDDDDGGGAYDDDDRQ